MRRLRALIVGLPPDSAIHRYQPEPVDEPTPIKRQSSSLDAIRRAGGKVIEIRRDEAS